MLKRERNNISQPIEPGRRRRWRRVFSQNSFGHDNFDSANEFARFPARLLQDFSVELGKSQVLSLAVCYISSRESIMDERYNLDRLGFGQSWQRVVETGVSLPITSGQTLSSNVRWLHSYS